MTSEQRTGRAHVDSAVSNDTPARQPTAARRRPAWLCIAPALPRPDRSSGDRRLQAMLTQLSLDCDISLVVLAPRDEDVAPYESALTDSGIRVAGYGSRALLTTLIARQFDAILHEFWFVADNVRHLVRATQPQATVVIDSVDLHYLRERSHAGNDASLLAQASTSEARELSAYRHAHATIAVSITERDELLARGVRPVFTVPNIVPLIERHARPREPVVLFIGGFRHPPNTAAVHWFANDVWPRVRRDLPHARWIIAGSDVPPDVAALHGLDGIDVRGFVKSTVPLLDEAEVSIAPLTYGGGMKGKVSEALAAGMPVVTTRWGSQGLERGAGSAFLVADDPDTFANAVIDVLRNEQLRERLGHAARQLARETCTIDVALPALAELVALSVKPRRGSLNIVARSLALATSTVARRLRRITSGA